MKERREYYRVSAFARVVLFPLAKSEEDSQRRRLRMRHVEPAPLGVASEDAGSSPMLDLLRRISLTLQRIERRLAVSDHVHADEGVYASPGAVEISLSASGFAGHLEIDVDKDQLFRVELDLWESGLPVIELLARAVGASDSRRCAFHFEEIRTEDRERIVQLALRTQAQELRQERAGGQ